MDQDEIVARLSVMDTLAAYNLSGDAAMVEQVAGTFTDDGKLDIGSHVFRGKDAILDFYRQRRQIRLDDAQQGRSARHFLSTSRVEVVAPDVARALSYFLLVRCGSIEQSGSYEDSFRRIDGRWLIARRKLELNWTRS